jgi:UDP-N-acetylmuramoylalanine--D-glutamate ligase
MYQKGYFKDKKITVMGLGLLGRGVGDIKFLLEDGAIVTVTDLKTEEELQSSVNQLKHFPNVSFSLGGHVLEDFNNKDMILKGAGVPLQNEFIDEARANNIPIQMSAALFCSLSPATHIGITGTRGKSTVTQFIYEGLKTADKNVYLGGNVRGVSTLAMLPQMKSEDYVVLELDSWQLQGFGEINLSPHISIFTTIYEDHMNYYKNDMNPYIADKANIFLNQKDGDTFILGEQAKYEVLSRFPDSESRTKIIDTLDELRGWKLNLPGEHNLYNASLAYTALQTLNISTETIKESFEKMEPVEGRLQLLKEHNGIKIYNDNNATTPDATVAGLDAVSEGSNVILIMGGADKKIGLDGLIEKIAQTVHKVLLLPGTGTDRLMKEYDLKDRNIQHHNAYDIKDSLKLSIDVARKGDVILFSPAFASFGQFVNEYEKNDEFVSAVNDLK